MATSIASQLAAIKSHVQADSEPLKRPFTRPSILYDPKQAADISVETIWDIANQGWLNVLPFLFLFFLSFMWVFSST